MNITRKFACLCHGILDQTQKELNCSTNRKVTGKTERREPLHDKVLVKMVQLSEDSHTLSFRRAIWLWSKLGRYTEFRSQEFAMEKQQVIRYHVKPDGTKVVRPFCLKDFIWYDGD